MEQIIGLLNKYQGVIEAIGLLLAIVGLFAASTKTIKKNKPRLKQNKDEGNNYQAGRDIILKTSGSKKDISRPKKQKNGFQMEKGDFAKIELGGILWKWYYGEDLEPES